MALVTQFYPDRIVTTAIRDSRIHSAPKKAFTTKKNCKSLLNLGKSKSSVSLSSTSKRNIRNSINSMYVLSKPRTEKIYNGKYIYNFRQSFITLTLPSTQNHSDVEIKKLLSLFLNRLRNELQVKNYVWKAELQKNKNIHFHLVIDKYISFGRLRYYWNSTINKLGYVDAYTSKFEGFSLKEYADYRGVPINDARNAYINGCRTKWRVPNSVDVVSVRTDKDVGNYLAKYLAKSDDSDIDIDRLSSFGKVWGRSTSLSKLKYINKFIYEEIKEYIDIVLKCRRSAFLKVYDYCTVIYLKVSNMERKNREYFEFIIRNNAKRYDYPFPYI